MSYYSGSSFSRTSINRVAAAIDDTDLKFYYTMNEGSGDLINTSRAAAKVASSDVTVTGATQGQTGQVGDAVDFDGTNDFARADGTALGDTSFLSQNNAVWTVMFWAAQDVNSTDILFSTAGDFTSGEAGCNLVINSTRFLRVQFGLAGTDGGDFTATGAAIKPNDTNFHFYMYQYDDATGDLKASVDNGTVETLNASINLTNTTTPNLKLEIGAAKGGTLVPFDGRMQQVIIFNKIVPTADITTMWNGGSGRQLYA